MNFLDSRKRPREAFSLGCVISRPHFSSAHGLLYNLISPFDASMEGYAMLSTTYPFADAMKQAQRAVQIHLRELEQVVAHPTAESLPQVRTRLKAVLGSVKDQFRAEARDGYMNAVREQDQRFESKLACLRDEHRELKRDLEFLVDEADALQQINDTFPDKVNAWIAHFRKHEKSEIDLIQEAFDVDVGGEGG
jgi:hypothetical protein